MNGTDTGAGDSTSEPKSADKSCLRPGPVFVSGRQHCGNTLVTTLIRRIPGYYALTYEGTFFEHRRTLDRLPDAAGRAAWLSTNLKSSGEEARSGRLRLWLDDYARKQPDTDALTLYRGAMDFLTQATGNRFWAQKATSYVFFAEEILADMADARLVYVIRNPFDLCASAKRRWPRRERVVRWGLSWKRGLRVIRHVARRFPDRVHVLRYEDLVQNPEGTTRRLCAFLNVQYDPQLLEVPHINPSENPYKMVAGSRGINRSRLFYFRDILSPAEVSAIRMLIPRGQLEAHYADLPHLAASTSAAARLGACGLIATGGLRYAVDRVQWARAQGVSPFRYIARRLFARSDGR